MIVIYDSINCATTRLASSSWWRQRTAVNQCDDYARVVSKKERKTVAYKKRVLRGSAFGSLILVIKQCH